VTPADRGGERQGLLTSPVFLVLWGAMLVSSTGTFFLLITASAWLLSNGGSGLSASAVFAAQWFLPVLLVSLVRRTCETPRLRRTAVSSESVQAVLSVCIGVLLAHRLVAALLVFFLVRGLLEAVTKTARVVYTRKLFDGPRLALASYTFNNSYYLGGALGGVLGVLLVGRVPVTTAAWIDSATFVVSACCYRWLPNVSGADGLAAGSARRRGTLRRTGTLLRGDSRLAQASVRLVIAIGVLQGFHNSARTIIPIRVLHLGEADVMRLQVVSGSAIFLGAVAVPMLLRRAPGSRRWLELAGLGVAAVSMGLLPRVPDALTMYIAYFIYLFAFEFVFTTAQATIIQRCPAAELVTLASVTNAVGTGNLVAVTLLTGGLSDVVPFATIAGVLAVLVACLGVGTEAFRWRSTTDDGSTTDDESTTDEESRADDESTADDGSRAGKASPQGDAGAEDILEVVAEGTET
jgi:hypothetical protein